ncbi:MAG TPA: hypothetical protein VGX71_23745 [Pseudaminobacter sp.]|nr:hypothetical protein [Pseudaminobacter sp.]
MRWDCLAYQFLAGALCFAPASGRRVSHLCRAEISVCREKYFGFAGTGEASKPSLTGAFRQGVICNLTDPTVLAFMLLPQFVHLSSGPAAMQFLILGATMKLSGLVMLGSVALASGAVGGWLYAQPVIPAVATTLCRRGNDRPGTSIAAVRQSSGRHALNRIPVSILYVVL